MIRFGKLGLACLVAGLMALAGTPVVMASGGGYVGQLSDLAGILSAGVLYPSDFDATAPLTHAGTLQVSECGCVTTYASPNSPAVTVDVIGDQYLIEPPGAAA